MRIWRRRKMLMLLQVCEQKLLCLVIGAASIMIVGTKKWLGEGRPLGGVWVFLETNFRVMGEKPPSVAPQTKTKQNTCEFQSTKIILPIQSVRMQTHPAFHRHNRAYLLEAVHQCL